MASFAPEIERALLQDPQIQRELQRQARDLAEVEAARDAITEVAALPERGGRTGLGARRPLWAINHRSVERRG
jgi:hypothetical protein